MGGVEGDEGDFGRGCGRIKVRGESGLGDDFGGSGGILGVFQGAFDEVLEGIGSESGGKQKFGDGGERGEVIAGEPEGGF